MSNSRSVTDDWPIAVHESGHAVAACLLKATRGAGPVTIKSTGRYAGMCFAGRAPRPREADWSGLAAPYPLVPSRLRRGFESHVMVALAGQAAADRYAGRGVPVPATEPEHEPLPALVLPVREQTALDRAGTCEEPPRSDLGDAMKTLLALHFDDLGLAEKHLVFLQHETEALLAGQRAGRMIHALAVELMRYRTLSARQWRAVLAGVA